MTFDYTVHLSDALSGIVVAAFGWSIRRTYRLVADFIETVEKMDVRLERAANVIDIHSEAIAALRLGQGLKLPKVAHKRRRTDSEEFIGDGDDQA